MHQVGANYKHEIRSCQVVFDGYPGFFTKFLRNLVDRLYPACRYSPRYQSSCRIS